MKWLTAGLTFVNFSTLFGLILGALGHGLSKPAAVIALIIGALIGAAAYIQTSDPEKVSASETTPSTGDGPIPEKRLSKRAERKLRRQALEPTPSAQINSRRIWFWILGVCFAVFALRSFCWLIYIEGDQWRIQSPYNLGDLALHITYIKNFASGVPLWPDNPIYVFSKLRYPAGIDIFNSLLCKADFDLLRNLAWVGLLASAATCYAFWRWGGAFGIAGFLFNGGLIGFQVIKQFKFIDYQGDQAIAWKSIPLTMFVTQRGLLYAIPVALLLLWNWREKFWPENANFITGVADPAPSGGATGNETQPIPFWVELSLYASLPLFHFHTFLGLSVVLFCFFALECSLFAANLIRNQQDNGEDPAPRPKINWAYVLVRLPIAKHLLLLVGGALIPATMFVWLITDHFRAGSVVAWEPGWVQAGKGDAMARSFFSFWFLNFGLWMPLVLTYVGLVGMRIWKTGLPRRLTAETAFLTSAIVIFLMVFFFKLAPWGWDNTKLLIWAYFIVLPFLWRDLIAEWPLAVRSILCIALFGSGFVSMVGGLNAGHPGFGFASRAEVDALGDAVRSLPPEGRFAGFPIYNHPLLLQGRRMVMGYPGHLWTQGFADYGNTERQLKEVMQGGAEWRKTAKKLGVRYIYWGRQEETNYPMSTRPWQKSAPRVATGKDWGSIYDLEPNSDVGN